jgi:hypothetical protein
MTTNAAPPGWHPDPANPTGAMRWWDGAAWSDQTQPVSPPAAQYGSPATQYGSPAPQYGPPAAQYGPPTAQYGSAGAPYGSPGVPAGMPGRRGRGFALGANAGFRQRNTLSLTAIGVVIVYVLLAVTTRFVIFGIFPVFLSIRATRRREPLAPLAIAAAVIAVLVAILALR